MTSNRHWTALCDILGFSDWRDSPEFDSNRKRSGMKRQITPRVTAAVATFDYDDLTAKLEALKVPFAPVNTPLSLLDDTHLNEAGHWLDVSGAGQAIKAPKLPIHLAGSEFTVREQPPALGQHTDLVLAELGYSADEIAALKEKGVVRLSDKMLEIDAE